MRAAGLASVLLAVSALAGCTLSSTGRMLQEIIGGAPDPGDAAVVMIYVAGPDQSFIGICSGSVVSPHVVLTAAHCIDPSSVGTGATWQVFLGDDDNDPAQQIAANWVDVTEAHVHPMYSLSSHDHDIGVLITSSALPMAPIGLLQQPLTDAMVGQSARIIGFGDHTPDASSQSSAFVRYEAPITLSLQSESFLEFHDGIHDICGGDSGGPALMTIDGVEVEVGVNFATGGGTMAQNEGCDGAPDTVATPVTSNLSFIDGYIAMFDSPSAMPDLSSEETAADLAGNEGKKSGGCSVGGRDTPILSLYALLSLLAVALIRSRTQARSEENT